MAASNKAAAAYDGAIRDNQVLYRDNYMCQPQHPGCQQTATIVELTRTVEELDALRRDPNNPDNWWSVCTNCQRHDGS